MDPNTKSTTESNIYDALFALLRSTLWGEERFPFITDEENPLDWDAIYKELSWQTIHTLPTDLLCRLDAAHRPKYMLHASHSMSRWYAVMEAQKELCEQLHEAHIPFVIMKGAASACYYPQPVYRQMGDVDLLVPPEYFEQARLLMLEKNYRLLEEDTFRHLEFMKNNVMFELHRVFAAFKEPGRAELFDNLLFDAFKRLEIITVEGYSLPVFPSAENGLVLLAHIHQHLESGLGLRQILDWVLYVDKVLDDEMWEHTFAPIVRRLGLKTLAVAVTRMCQIHLGLRADITWCASADEDICHRLMDYIMDQGNFGRKGDKSNHKSVKALSILQNFKKLQHLGLERWPAVTKYPHLKSLLTPFAWFWQLCHYIQLGLKREQPFKTLVKDIKKSHAEATLMEILNVNQK